MKKIITIFLLLTILLTVLLSLTGCDNQVNNDDIKAKITQELNYLDTKISNILNKLNNISLQNYTITSEEITLGQKSSSGSSEGNSSGGGESSGGSGSSGPESEGKQEQSSSQNQSGSESNQSNITTTKMEPESILESDENDIDWKSIKNEIEIINEAWGVIILDLSTLNVNNDDILGFSSALDDSILSIKDEKKPESLTKLAKLYSFIPKIERGISAENSIQNIKQVKSYVINAYSLVETGDWAGIQTNIAQSEETFNNLINDMEYMKDKEYKVNKTYVLIKELQNSLGYKDKKIFYVKYKNLMESINVL